MTGLEVILAALIAGAASGTSNAAGTAVNDAYTGLRNVLRRRLQGREQAVQQLDAEPTDDPVWRTRLAEHLTATGANHDCDVLDAARRILAAADPAGTQAGKYTVHIGHATGTQIGDHTIHVQTNTGGAVGTFQGDVTFNNHIPPVPPAPPAAS